MREWTGYDANQNANSLVNSLPGIDFFKKVADVNDIAPVIDPYRSIIVAGATMCLPAMVMHAETLVVNECHYSGCLERSAYLGMPSGNCDLSKAYNQCIFVSGAVLDAIPYTALTRTLGAKLNQIAEDPYGFIAAGVVTAVCSSEAADFLTGKEGGIAYGACQIANKISELGKIVPIYNNIKSSFTNPTAQSKCDSLTSGYSMDQLVWELTHQPQELNDLSNTYTLDNGDTMTCGYDGCVYGDFLIKFNLEFDNKDNNKFVPDSEIDITDMEFFVISDDGTAEYIAIDSAWQTLGEIITAQGGVLQVDPVIGQSVQDTPSQDEMNEEIESLIASGTIEEVDQAFGIAAISSEDAIEAIETMIDNDEMRELFESMGFVNSDGTINVNNFHNIMRFKDAQKQGFRDVHEQYLKAVELGTGEEFITYQNDQADVAKINLEISIKERSIVEIRELEENVKEFSSEIEKLEKEFDTADDARKLEIGEENDEYNKKLDEAKTDLEKKIDEAGTIGDLKSAIGDKDSGLKKELGIAEEIAEISGRFAAAKTLHHTTFGNFVSWQTWGTFLDFGRAASTIAGFFHDQEKEDWQVSVQEFVTTWTASDFEKTICEGNLNSPGTSGSVMVASRSGLMPAAMIYGSRADISSGEWEYIIAVDIQNMKKDGLKFNIVLEDPGSSLVELNSEGDTLIELAEGETFTKKGMATLYFSENKEYSKVCIKFLNNNLGDYFDDYSLSNNKLCQELIIE